MNQDTRKTVEEHNVERFENGDIIEQKPPRSEEDRYFVSPSIDEGYEDPRDPSIPSEDPYEVVEGVNDVLDEDSATTRMNIEDEQVPRLLYGWGFATQEMDFTDLTGDLYLEVEDGKATVRYELDADIPAYSARTSPEDIMTHTPQINGEVTAGLDSPTGKEGASLVIEASHSATSQEDAKTVSEFLADVEKSIE